MKCKEQVQINPLCVTANGNILASGNLCFKVFKLQLRGCLNEKKRPVYSPANRVPRLTGMILIFVYMINFIQVCREENVTLCFVSWDAIYHKSTPSKTHFFPLSLLQKVTFTSESILFSLQHTPFLSLWNILLFLWNIAQPTN